MTGRWTPLTHALLSLALLAGQLGTSLRSCPVHGGGAPAAADGHQHHQGPIAGPGQAGAGDEEATHCCSCLGQCHVSDLTTLPPVAGWGVAVGTTLRQGAPPRPPAPPSVPRSLPPARGPPIIG